MDFSPSGSSIQGTFQARVPEWVPIAFSDREEDCVMMEAEIRVMQLQAKEC